MAVTANLKLHNKRFLIFSPGKLYHEVFIDFLSKQGSIIDLIYTDQKVPYNIRTRKWDLEGFIYFPSTVIKILSFKKRCLKAIRNKKYDYFIVFANYPLFGKFIKIHKN